VLTPQPSLQLPAAVTSRTPSPASQLAENACSSGAAAAAGQPPPQQLPIQARALVHTDSGRSCATAGLSAGLAPCPLLRISPLQVCFPYPLHCG
jgi:hypothetical protein